MQKGLNIGPSCVRFIRLGPGNRWAKACIEKDQIVLSHREVPHDVAVAGNWALARNILEADANQCKATVTSALRELSEFYTLGPNCLWVTFWEGKLWWAFAEADVMPLAGEPDRDGARYRRVIGHWQSTDIFGRQLSIQQLSDDLTKTRRHRRTVCRVGHEDYAVRAINGLAA